MPIHDPWGFPSHLPRSLEAGGVSFREAAAGCLLDLRRFTPHPLKVIDRKGEPIPWGVCLRML